MERSCLSLALFALTLAASPAWAAGIDGRHPPCGAPGDLLYVQGTGFAKQPVVTLGGHQAEVVRARTDAILCRVPDGLEEGPAALLVDGVAVTGLWPNRQPKAGANRPVVLEGSGFDSPSRAAGLRVVWTDGIRALEGTIVCRSDRVLRVVPPGGCADPLPVGTWTVFVILDGGGDARTAAAGTHEVSADE